MVVAVVVAAVVVVVVAAAVVVAVVVVAAGRWLQWWWLRQSLRGRGCGGGSLGALIPNIGRDPPSQNTRAEVLDTRSSGSCRGRVVANACLGWSYG